MNRREAIGVALAATIGVATSKPCDLCADPLCDGLIRCGFCYQMPQAERPLFARVADWSDHCVAVHGRFAFTAAELREELEAGRKWKADRAKRLKEGE